MGKFFNIAEPCTPEDHYMPSATARVPEVVQKFPDPAMDLPMIDEKIVGEAQYSHVICC